MSFTKKHKLGCVFLSLLLTLFCSSCSKEKEDPLNPESTAGRFENAPFKWDFVHPATTADDMFIGDRNISVKNWYVVTPPAFYVGAAYTEKEFKRSFKPEIAAYKKPIDVIFTFTKPFTGTLEKGSGASGYMKLLVKSLDSQEYKEYIESKHSSLGVKLVEIYSSTDLNKVFPNNDGILGENLAKVMSNGSKINDVKSRLAGELSSINFTSYMDYPANGFFQDKENDMSQDNPVYVRSISYGKAAFFVIESKYSYKEVADAVLSKLSLSNVENTEDILKNSTITLFTVADSQQTAEVYRSFTDLDAFLNTPFTELSYGYPIFCQGAYAKDNTPFRED
ncbi:hypothetical protein [uncultured Bacteroides sp.]|uniref:hypothetical protein n=1 Tax=uncultured Bacteroides sp. TaxID=162156 RepID=UPI0025FAE01C|nr:hypothetical protein [uncultured Bacteroides sp.]